jgi:hypothetical protein
MVTGKSGHVLSEIAIRTEPAKLEINVIFTDCHATLSALRDAAKLAPSLNARIRIILPAIVPYPLKADEPPVCRVRHQRMLRTVTDEIRIATVAEIVYCRDYADLNRAMPAHSIVVIGGRRHWWRRWGVGRTLGRVLRDGGNHVLAVIN